MHQVLQGKINRPRATFYYFTNKCRRLTKENVVTDQFLFLFYYFVGKGLRRSNTAITLTREYVRVRSRFLSSYLISCCRIYPFALCFVVRCPHRNRSFINRKHAHGPRPSNSVGPRNLIVDKFLQGSRPLKIFEVSWGP